MEQQIHEMIRGGVSLEKGIFSHEGKHRDRQVMIEVGRSEYLRDVPGIHTVDIGVQYNAAVIIPIDKSVTKGWQKSDERHACDDQAIKRKAPVLFC